MITDTLAEWRRYAVLSPRFAAAFAFLETLPAAQPDGRCDIDGDDCFALVQSYTTRPLAEAKFEAHRKYADIQYVESGRECILWAPLARLTQVTSLYAVERDIAFFANPPQWSPVHLHAGQFAIFFPADGHAPGIECNEATAVRKVVLKVRA